MALKLSASTLRPYLVLAAIIVLLALVDGGQARFLNRATALSVMQQFATLGPFALALGLSMVIREFDISIAGMLSLAGCVAVLAGADRAWLGLVAVLLLGAGSGALQGWLVMRLRLASVGVTLGGLLTLGGLATVLTDNQVIAYPNRVATETVNAVAFGVLTWRSVLAVLAFVVAAAVMHLTRVGRDVVAVGSDRRAAHVAGVRVGGIVVGVFAVSGLLTALAGGLLSYSLAAASPVALANVLIPAVAAAIMGGVSLAGGRGTPFGIAGGVLVVCVLRSGLTAIGAPPYMPDLVTGAVLLAVALIDAPDLRLRWRRRPPAAA